MLIKMYENCLVKGPIIIHRELINMIEILLNCAVHK